MILLDESRKPVTNPDQRGMVRCAGCEVPVSAHAVDERGRCAICRLYGDSECADCGQELRDDGLCRECDVPRGVVRATEGVEW